MDADSWRRHIAPVAKALFGRPARPLLAIWVLERGEAFYAQEVQHALHLFGEAPSAVLQELHAFVDLGMLTSFEDGRRKYFTRTDSTLWTIFSGVSEALSAGSAPSAALGGRSPN